MVKDSNTIVPQVGLTKRKHTQRYLKYVIGNESAEVETYN